MRYVKKFFILVVFSGFTTGIFSQEKTFGFGFHTEFLNNPMMYSKDGLSVNTINDFKAGTPYSSLELFWKIDPSFNLIIPLGYTRTESTNPDTYVHLLEAGIVGIYYLEPLKPDVITPLIHLGVSVLGIHDSWNLATTTVYTYKEYAIRTDLAFGIEYLFSSNIAFFSTAGLQFTYLIAPKTNISASPSYEYKDRFLISTMVLVGARFYIW